ncbi:Glutamate decarboxylase 2 [Perkinsus chesapeaki]|uniref:Glutamate decarboxylase 2 n=1 Tax=Perkinsus chesapeaki TaxID=330153 RepID=A0A7J6N072_PERCH|nr:Glutamate decarboxylase 2 [Perkinsus chesapeaki]
MPEVDSSPADATVPLGNNEDLDILAKVDAMLESYVASLDDRSRKVVLFKSPEEISTIFSEEACDLSLEDGEPVSESRILSACEATLALSVRTGHPHFFNQLIGRADVTGIAGEMLVAATNGSAYTYEVAPVFLLIEQEVINKTLDLVGFSRDTAEGLTVPGGSMSNLYALQTARYYKFPEVKTRGIFAIGGEPVAYCSAGAHYSYMKAAHVVGIGSDNMVEIPMDSRGRMRADLLESQVAQDIAHGKKPFFVGATAGTTVWGTEAGAFDDLIALRRVCDKFGLWLHVDGAWGGAVLLSPKYKEELLAGVDMVDSFCWNPHKMVGAPLQCSIFTHNKGRGLLQACNGTCAAYLFQKEKNYASYDKGDWTIQCGRKPDGFKIWLAWKRLGDEGIRLRVEHGIKLAKYAADEIVKSSTGKSRFAGKFILHHDPEYANVCFWYLPPCLSDLKLLEGLNDEEAAKLSKVTPYIKDKMQREGLAMITFTGPYNFFRWTFSSPRNVGYDDVDIVLDDIDRIGRDF